MNPQGAQTPEEREECWVVPRRAKILAGAASVLVMAAALHVFFARGLTNQLGDAMAHMEGARRIFDSLNPGYQEIGTVWLPLYHILVAPLAQNNYLWRTGLGGSLVSAAAFALMAWLLFLLASEMTRSIAAGTVTVAALLLAPSLLYLASAPLTEPLTLLWSVATVYSLFRFQQSGKRRFLLDAAGAALLGTLTRYDGWYLLPFAALFVFFARKLPWRARLSNVLIFSVIAGAGPVLWFAHNLYRFGNPLAFMYGPFSARAIYTREIAATGFRYPTDGHAILSLRYYLEDVKLVIGAWPMVLAMLGLVAWVLNRRARARQSAALLFLVPLPFYVQAMSHAAIPLYVPTLYPFSYYNLRYGLELMPALSLFPAFVFSSLMASRVRAAILGAFLLLLAVQGIAIARGGARKMDIVRESLRDNPCHSPGQARVIQYLRRHYDGRPLLMALGKWPCVAPSLDIPYHHIVTEANRSYWRKMKSDPQDWVEWIVTRKGDDVDDLMRSAPAAFSNFTLVRRWPLGKSQRISIYRLKWR